ncbi:MASE1 domain-containing protein [Streptomyces sp. CC77]|uniref:MASE1 domain-containing protein n=1 Tax=Streptomyces sp. CC77 TaxID=1906739 RepID=UPI0008DDDE7A|nr:MASE1 domain-containing protein [Streptomyces sp. CC77]OII63765.1 hypothetical protein BJP39_09885 [Streptomyces sp. CC77]
MAVADRYSLRRGVVVALQIGAVAALYYASGRLGLLQQLVRGQVSPLWPPTGIALAGLLLVGPRVWPGITLGAFLVNVSLGPSVPAILLITAGNTLAPLCAYALLRLTGFRTRMNRLWDALALVFLGAFTSMLVSATIGSVTLHVTHAAATERFWPTWWVWWTGDAMGVLLVAPVLLVLRSLRRPQGTPPARWAEAATLAAATAVYGFLLLATVPAPVLFLGFPLLTWAAFRFQHAGAAPCALAVCTSAILAATHGVGPFTGLSLLTSMVSLQVFNGAAALTALLLAATVAERNQTQWEIEQAVERLSEMVARATPDDGAPHVLPGGRDDEQPGPEDGGPPRQP